MEKKEQILLFCSICSFFLMSVSFLLMPFEFKTEGVEWLNLLAGIMFWAFLALGIMFQIVLSGMRKKLIARKHIRKNQLKNRIGIFSFFQNVPARIADVLLVIGLMGFIISVIVTEATGYACYVFAALTVFSFCAHCILNGKNYYFVANKKEILKNLQTKHSGEKE